MWWLIVIAIIILFGLVNYQFNSDRNKERIRVNGGMKNIFKNWDIVANELEMRLIKFDSTKLIYRRDFYNDNGEVLVELYLKIQSTYANMSQCWVSYINGQIIKSKIYRFNNYPDYETVSKILKLLIDDLKMKGSFDLP